MTTKERILWTLGFVALVAALVATVTLARMLGIEGRSESPLIGEEAPSLSLRPVGDPPRPADPLELRSLRGEVVLLDFWASWCGPCRQSIPALNEVHHRFEGRIQMYGVNVDSGLDAAGVARAHERFGAEFPSLIDERGDAQVGFSVTSIPTLVLIDREGIVRYIRRGVPDPDEVSDAVDELL